MSPTSIEVDPHVSYSNKRKKKRKKSNGTRSRDKEDQGSTEQQQKKRKSNSALPEASENNAKKSSDSDVDRKVKAASTTITRLPNNPSTSQRTGFSEELETSLRRNKKHALVSSPSKPITLAKTETGDDTDGARPGYSFEVDDTDHCETPLEAYRDLVDLLDQLAKSLGKNRSTLSIYDPYYCNGGVKQKLVSLGFRNVTNRNRDFYEDIAKKSTPDYDILITNPPYSGVHMEKLLTFASKDGNKPFLLLLPHFVYTKDYYARALRSKTLFFLVPEARYAYVPPNWVTASDGSKALAKGKDKTAPFPSFWYCHTSDLLPAQWLTQTFGPSGMVRPKHRSKLRYAQSTKEIPRDFKGEFDVTKKRPNPKARKREAKKRREEAMGALRR